jgi:hypothetical protein
LAADRRRGTRPARRRELSGHVLPQRLVPRPDRQEFLLAGCPVVGVRTGALFIRDGVTGVFVDRLPLGAKRVKNDADEAALATFMEGIQYGLELKRETVRASAASSFGMDRIVDQIVAVLETVRSYDSARLGSHGPGAVQTMLKAEPVSTASATGTRKNTSSSITD